MLVGLWSETNFLDHEFGGLGLLFLGVFALLELELLVVHHAAHGGLGLGRNQDEIQFLPLGDFEGLLDGINALLHVVTHQAHLAGTNFIVDQVGVFVIFAAHLAIAASGPGGIARALGPGTIRFFVHSAVLQLLVLS